MAKPTNVAKEIQIPKVQEVNRSRDPTTTSLAATMAVSSARDASGVIIINRATNTENSAYSLGLYILANNGNVTIAIAWAKIDPTDSVVRFLTNNLLDIGLPI